MNATAEAGMAVGHGDPLEVLRAGCQAYLDAVLDPAVQRICAIDGPAVLSPEIRNAITDRYALGLVRETVQLAVEQQEIVDAPTEPLTRMLLAAVIAAAQFVATAADTGARARRGGTDRRPPARQSQARGFLGSGGWRFRFVLPFDPWVGSNPYWGADPNESPGF